MNIGQKIGDYEVIGLIGSGGMGTVYRVRHAISDRVEAMKVILPDLSSAPELLERFQREIKIQASLSHPNIASLYTAQKLGDQFLMFLEFVEGTSLHERMEQGPIEITEAVGYIRQTLSALAYAHERGVVHRDVKPRNILLTQDGVVKLTDFGIAKSAAEKHVTKTGAAIGSLYYMSPEQVKGGHGDARSDIYSTGVMLYELTVGKRPFDAASDYGIMAAHIHQMPVAPHEQRPGVPIALSRSILTALEKEPANRFQSAAEFRESLDTTGTRQSINGGAVGWDAAVLDKIRREFAIYIGPMARILVERLSKRARTLDELYRLLAAEIESEAERAKFMVSRRSLK